MIFIVLRKKNQWTSSVKKLKEESIIIEGKIIEPEFEKHLSGWNISAESPFTGKLLIIKEDGKFIENVIEP